MAMKVGIQLYSVRDEMKKDPVNAIRQVAEIGYKNLEFASSSADTDPGVGFGKTHAENLELIANPDALRVPGTALLMAASRKRVIAAVCGEGPAAERVAGTVAAHTASALFGADMVRAHDTLAAVQAARMADAVRKYRR